MENRYLLDSNTVIDYIARLHPERAREKLDAIIDQEMNTSVITKIEVLSYDPENDDNFNILVDFFDAANVFDLDNAIVNKTIQLRQKQKIKLPDAVIAATALTYNFILISRNVNDFKKIKGLQVVDPHKL